MELVPGMRGPEPYIAGAASPGLAINAKAKNPEAAKKFLAFYTDAKAVAMYNKATDAITTTTDFKPVIDKSLSPIVEPVRAGRSTCRRSPGSGARTLNLEATASPSRWSRARPVPATRPPRWTPSSRAADHLAHAHGGGCLAGIPPPPAESAELQSNDVDIERTAGAMTTDTATQVASTTPLAHEVRRPRPRSPVARVDGLPDVPHPHRHRLRRAVSDPGADVLLQPHRRLRLLQQHELRRAGQLPANPDRRDHAGRSDLHGALHGGDNHPHHPGRHPARGGLEPKFFGRNFVRSVFFFPPFPASPSWAWSGATSCPRWPPEH